MYLENGKISERQCFRIGVLENIAMGIVLIPYITANVAGRWHFPSLIIGLIFAGIYAVVIFFFSKAFPEGMISYINESLGGFGKIIQVVYVIRYAVRGGLIIIFFGSIIQRYMLRSFNMWLLIIPFVIISGYGGNKDIEKRGRLLELLFWWMIVPIIFVAVFSVSNLDWEAIPEMIMTFPAMGNKNQLGKIFLGAYMVLVILSSTELMQYTLVRQKKNTWENALKILIWVFIAVLIAHILIIAVLGKGWTGHDSTAVFSVMESSVLPGGAVERLDYPVLAFWIIGIFAILSGYMFYTKEIINHLCSGEDYRERKFSMPVVVLIFTVSSYIWSRSVIARYLTWYIVWIDVSLSIIIPVIVWLIKRERVNGFLKGTKKFLIFVFVMGEAFLLTGCRNPGDTVEITKDVNIDYRALDREQESLENRDYVVSMDVSGGSVSGDKYTFEFEIADLEAYQGSSEGNLKIKEYECEADNLKNALEYYNKTASRQLDLGHMKEAEFDDDLNTEQIKVLINEMSEMPSLPKSVSVKYEENNIEKNISLRQMIKEIYDGEDF